MVALVRAGVTATCTIADKPRYGDLAVDSNLPDVRIALGGPEQNAFTAAVLAEPDPATPRSWNASWTAPARRGCGCPRRRRSRRRGCPAPTCGASGRCRCSSSPAATASTTRSRSFVEDLADAEIVGRPACAADVEPFDARTVAVLNRGVPGFAVDPDGTLHTSLMRSCTGWPSGHLDRPARGAPPPTAPTSSCSTGRTPSTTRWSPATATGGPPSRPAVRSSPSRCWRRRNTGAAGGLPAGERCWRSNRPGVCNWAR